MSKAFSINELKTYTHIHAVVMSMNVDKLFLKNLKTKIVDKYIFINRQFTNYPQFLSIANLLSLNKIDSFFNGYAHINSTDYEY